MSSGLFREQRFRGFGPSVYHPDAVPAEIEIVRGESRKALRQELRLRCPSVPGVYGMVDAKGQLIYVGKAKSLRTRLLSYFRAAAEEKAHRIIDRAVVVLWEPTGHELIALLRELELIQRWRPGYNVEGMPGRQRVSYIVLNGSPAATLSAQRMIPQNASAVFGPLPNGGKVADAVRRLNDWFQLRDCAHSQTMRFADQGTLFDTAPSPGCLRAELGTCTAPCAAGVTRRGYAAQARKAKAFLDGRDDGILSALEAGMLQAAGAMNFERAAALRDKLERLRWLQERLVWLQGARQEYNFVYPVARVDGRVLWIVLGQGQVHRVMPQPADGEGRQYARRVLQTVFRPPATPGGNRLPQARIDSLLLIAKWFRKHPEEKRLLLAPSEALKFVGPNYTLRAG